MTKHFWLKFHVNDWMTDPAVAACSPATRGVWIDLLCAMHKQDRVGELRGTAEQLARIARCSPSDVTSALTDLQTTGAAELECRNGAYLVTNRRMKREHEERIDATKRKQKSRKNSVCHKISQPCHTATNGTQTNADTGDTADPPNVSQNGHATELELKKELELDKKIQDSANSGELRPKKETPEGLVRLTEAWNSLPKGLAPRCRDPASDAVLKGWSAAQKNPELRELLADPQAIAAQIIKAKYCHRQGWFRLPWLFATGKTREFNLVKLMEGAYVNGEKTERRAAGRNSLFTEW